MVQPVTLFAWAVPAWDSESPVDHTWVTSYDNRIHAYPTITEVVGANQFFWYCWGSFHAVGGTPVNPNGLLGQQPGDLAVAQCLVRPNLDSRTSSLARGTIYHYGVDGVCHQLANQVLYATGLGGGGPMTVHNARGYLLSSYIYGTYGLQQTAWSSKVASCTSQQLAPGPARPEGLRMGRDEPSPEADEFEKRAMVLLAGQPAKLGRLLQLRSEVQQFAARAWPGSGQPNALALNARNQELIDEAARLLGPDDFRKLFGADPGAKVNLVDPHIANSAGEIPPPKQR
ncbi:hypothetical protein LPW26_14975 [Rhodopseudomonas sp. HC1]|uniref:hypothetical protein n=1 Tax=Rhodopseudomonas infernalis TaxID=2897386 RepID=UPI001EE964DC|nr:hypothetical protein [Rhodopseudomonas infernalis]MCG6205953.1 hypothetical protein [Rhodopseudomonas infernalis]